MLWAVAGVLAALGLLKLLKERTMSGWIVSTSLLFLAMMLMLVQAGIFQPNRVDSQGGALMLIAQGAAFATLLATMSLRYFILSRRTETDSLQQEEP